MSQQPPPFFRLPRELRDEIYQFLVLETGGYRHDPVSGRLLTAEGTQINLSLSLVCKQAAEEIRNIPFKKNAIKFSSFTYASTKAKEFERLRDNSASAVRTMLAWAADCVTSEHIETMHSAYPHHEGVRTLLSSEAITRKRYLEREGIPIGWKMLEHVTLQAVHDLVALIQTDPRFLLLSAKEYDPKLRNGQVNPRDAEFHEDMTDEEEWYMSEYAPDSQKQIVEWNPQPWDIPESTDLEKIADLMPGPDWLFDSTVEVEPKKRWYYSGSASAIQFLRKTHPDTRMNIRKIEIEELHFSVCKMESHAHGLIPYCKENSRLHVEIKIDLWRCVLLDCWSNSSRRLVMYCVINGVARWLREASLLSVQGMPRGQCMLVFEGEEPDLTQIFWDGIKRIAAVYEAIGQLPEPPDPDDLRHPLLNTGIPSDFSDLVRQAINGKLPVRFDVSVGEPWNLEQAFYDLKHSIPWENNWRNVVDLSELERQKERWDEIRKDHYVQD
jgi:hypothetical protein